MKKITNNQEINKSKALVTFEYVLLIYYLGMIILRTLYTEGPATQTSSVPVLLNDSLYSLYVSSALLFPLIIWLVWSICGKQFSYRVTGLEIGLLIFCAAAIVSGVAASDKRLAINNIVSMFTPIFCAILMVQILDSNAKIKLLLAVIAALGIVFAYQCADQVLFINKENIAEFENNPDITLESLNIQKESLQHFLFEQRLHSNNANAFFTTRNSAGSFFLLALFSLAALMVESNKQIRLKVLFAVILVGIFLTRSKGAIISMFFATALIGLYLKFGVTLKKHRKAVLILSLLLVVAGTSLIAFYGIKYHTLPGGNSMMVRWQYWQASAKMFIDHFWAGVGPGNFSIFYTYYKPAAALETVTDPHNFPLSIMTQYGIFGFVGFLLMIFLPLWNSTKNSLQNKTQAHEVKQDKLLKNPITIIALCVAFGLLLSSIMLNEAFRTGNLLVMVYLLLRFCIPPIIVFSLSLYLIRKYTYKKLENEQNAKSKNTFGVIIFCAILGFLLHNLTDYAIFELGIYTAFWFLLASLIAVSANNNNIKCFVFKPAPYIKFTTISVAVATSFVFLLYALIPVASSTSKIKQANEAFAYGGLQKARQLLDSAAEDDKLSSYALSLSASLFSRIADKTPSMKLDLLRLSEEYLKKAIKRDDAIYKNYEDLSEVYLKQSEISPPSETSGLLILALSAAIKAKDLYEGNEQLNFNVALINDHLGYTEMAVKYYKKAVEIEDQYRTQFREMYPKEKIISRLGEEPYEFAKKRIVEITSQPNP